MVVGPMLRHFNPCRSVALGGAGCETVRACPARGPGATSSARKREDLLKRMGIPLNEGEEAASARPGTAPQGGRETRLGDGARRRLTSFQDEGGRDQARP